MDMEAGHDHVHNHTASGGGDSMGAHDKYHNSVGRNPDGSYYYIHGACVKLRSPAVGRGMPACKVSSTS